LAPATPRGTGDQPVDEQPFGAADVAQMFPQHRQPCRAEAAALGGFADIGGNAVGQRFQPRLVLDEELHHPRRFGLDFMLHYQHISLLA
jgi:hypothetical protein